MLAVGTTLGPYEIATPLGGHPRVTVPTFPFSNAPLGPKAISTFCSR
jgi:hypothetical protein